MAGSLGAAGRVGLADDGQSADPVAIGAAIVPGVLLHGSGSFVAGERQTARRLLALEGVGLAIAGVGAVPLLATGASRWVSGPSIALIASGMGMVLVGWVADIYSAAGGAGIAGSPRTEPGEVEVELGYAHVGDSQFDYGEFMTLATALRWRAWRFGPEIWLALDDDNQRWRAHASYRFIGPGSGESAASGSFVETGVAATYHRYGGDGFEVGGVEVASAARYDLAPIGRRLAGAFVDFHLGLELERIRYGDATPSDVAPQILLGFGFGFYLGDRAGPQGEVSAHYGHRRDGFAGGLGLSRTGGWFGHFGLAGTAWLGAGWGLRAGVEVGSAMVTHLAVVAELGGRR